MLREPLYCYQMNFLADSLRTSYPITPPCKRQEKQLNLMYVKNLNYTAL